MQRLRLLMSSERMSIVSYSPRNAFVVLDWRPSMPWAIAFSVLAATAIMRTGGKSESLYWQF